MNNSVFEKTLEDVRKYSDIKLVTIHKRKNQLASELNFYTIIIFCFQKTYQQFR